MGIIADIERCSTHDGPGLRTVVFIKGCPLSCIWCHNPECISSEVEELFYENKCIGCGHCDEGCVTGARVVCGRDMSADEVLASVLEDRDYYGESGGLTVSGGEPLAHHDFTREILSLSRKAGIHSAIETSMYRYDEEILSLCDLIMCDIKVFDSEVHKTACGIGNESILENIKKASELGIPIIVRTPIIIGINSDTENIKNTANFLKSLKNIKKYELLPYHPIGLIKARALGLAMKEFPIPSNDLMKELKKYADLS